MATGARILVARHLALAHEALARGAHERDRLGEQYAHGVPERERLLVGAAGDVHALERGRREVDRGVQRQGRELLALRLRHRLRLLRGELLQAAHELLGIAAEREIKAAFHLLSSRSRCLWIILPGCLIGKSPGPATPQTRRRFSALDRAT